MKAEEFFEATNESWDLLYWTSRVYIQGDSSVKYKIILYIQLWKFVKYF